MNNPVLSLLGLALRGGRLVIGEEPTALAARAGQARLILLAADAADNTLRRGAHLAQEGHCLHLTLPFSKAELGGALGRGTAAVAALTDTGLAAAVTERLALQDPERYGEAAARMDLKRRRALERQSAPRRDPPPKDTRRPPSPPGKRDRRTPGDRRDGRPGRAGPPEGGRKPRPAGRDRPRPGEPGERRSPSNRPKGSPPRGARRPDAGRPPRKRGGPGPSGRPGSGGKPDTGGGRRGGGR